MCGRCLGRNRSVCLWAQPVPELTHTAPNCSTEGSGSKDRKCDSLARCSRLPSLTAARPSCSAAFGISNKVGIPGLCAWDLMRRANRAIHGAYFDDYYSILVPSLPIILDSSSYLHSWLALGAILLEQSVKDGHWAQVALQCHTKAVQGLYKHLCAFQEPAEWAVCTLVLLHIYERYGNARQPPSDAHAKSIRTVFLRRYSNFPPKNTSQLLQLSSLIYRVAVINIFRPQSSDDDPDEYHCLDEPVNIWASSGVSSGLWQHSLWIGLTPQVFNIVFKLSTLVRLAPLTTPWLAELDKLQDEIALYDGYLALSSPAPSSNEASAEQGGFSTLMVQSCAAHCLYICAFRVLVARLRGVSMAQSHTCNQQNSDQGLRLLQQLIDTDFVTMTLLWPAVMVSLDASTPDDQATARTFLARLDPAGGLQSINSVRRLFDAAWDVRGGRMLCSDILFKRDMVADVFL